MNLKELRKLTPIQRLVHWIVERESVRLKKEAGLPQPWTDDEIIGTYRFCNAKRMDDKVSKWLMERWYKPYFNHPNMVYAVALARFINKPESLFLITDDVFAPKVKWGQIKKILRAHRDAGNVIFNGAYMVRGNDGHDKIECVVDHYVKPLQSNLVTPGFYPDSMQRTCELIHDQYGFGSFMAGQVVADLRWAVKGTWDDRMTWAPIGPGSQRGMNRLLGLDTHRSIPQKEFLTQLIGMIDALHEKLPASITDRLEAHDYQNCLCEYDKYNRALFGEGRPKQLYRQGVK